MKRITWLLLSLLLLVACSNETGNTGTEKEKDSPKPTATTAPEPEIYSAKLTAVGDLMVHDHQIENAYDNKTDSYNFDYSFEQVKGYLSKADYTIGNLETTLAGEEAKYTGYPMFNTPDAFGQAIKNAGFDLLSTANNHSYDRYETGIYKTIDVLDQIGLDHVGTYKTQEAQNTVFIKEVNNIKFAFVSFTYGTNGIPVPQGKEYTVNLLSEEMIKQEIAKAKTLDPDVIIALPHMGNEYELKKNDTFVKWADLMFEAGADIVLANHPHVVQPVEFKYVQDENGEERKVFVAYSLGNFISSQRPEPREAGVMLHLYFNKLEGEGTELTNVTYTPTWVQFEKASGEKYIRTLPVYDILRDAEAGGNKFELTNQDLERVKRVHQELSQQIINESLPLTNQQEEYVIHEQEEE